MINLNLFFFSGLACVFGGTLIIHLPRTCISLYLYTFFFLRMYLSCLYTCMYIFHFCPTQFWMQVPDMMNRPSLEKPTDFNNLSAEGNVGERKETANRS